MGRCMFFTVLLCLVLSLSEEATATTTGSSPTITIEVTTDGNASTTTENATTISSSSGTTAEKTTTATVKSSTASESSPTATTHTTTGSSPTISAAPSTDGGTSATSENTAATPPSSTSTEKTTTATVKSSTASESSPTATTHTTTGSSPTISAAPSTDGGTSATSENTAATPPSSTSTEKTTTATVKSSTASESSPTATTHTTTGSSPTISAAPSTDGGTSATSENTAATPPSSTEKTTTATVKSSTASESSPTATTHTTTGSSPTISAAPSTDGGTSATSENTAATPPSSTEKSTTATVKSSTASESSPTGTASTTTENATTISSLPGTTIGSTSTTSPETSTTSATPTLEELCKPNSCGGRLSTCVPLNTTHLCQCPYGFYYDRYNCHSGRVFPGVITLKQMLSSDIDDVNSMEYEKMVQNITQFFDYAFENMRGYRQTVIVKVNYEQKDTRTRSGNNLVTVTVMNIFAENATETEAEVEEAVRTAAERDSSYVSQYTNATQCAVYPCDDLTTTCEDGTYPVCVCRENFTKTAWDKYSCSDCSNCLAEENKFCVRKNGIPECKCMANFKEEGQKCVRCPVGYSGENCENNEELILIIVGTVLGAIILCLLVAVSVLSVRSRHSHDPEKKRLIKPRNSNSNTSEETRIFPRVQTTSGHANPGYQPNNPYEVHSSNRGDFVEKDYDDLYEISRHPEGFRMQRR